MALLASHWRKLKIVAVITLFLTAFILTWSYLSPWPKTLIIRYIFNSGGVKANKALEVYVPDTVGEVLDIPYSNNNENGKLDLFYPKSATKPLPVVVWVHGGAWVSGSKEQVGNYCRILASKGFAVAAIDYTIAPEAKYPKPVLQTLASLEFLQANANKYNLNANNFFLAGDSAGSQIAAQTANVLVNTDYAQLLGIKHNINPLALKGLLLFCGPFNAEKVNIERGFGSFLKTVLWAYSGTKAYEQNNFFKTVSVENYIEGTFPPSFISVGNGDPLQPQSKSLAKRLASNGVALDTLFFPTNYSPALPHEYQFDLDSDAGKLALEKAVLFLNRYSSQE